MKHHFVKRKIITGAITIIAVLLIVNIFLSHQFGERIEFNRRLHEQSEEVKSGVSRIAIDIIHNLDLGIRSYALFKDAKYLYPFHIAAEKTDSIMNLSGQILSQQGYDLRAFNTLRDSINSYLALNIYLKQLIDENRDEEFLHLADQDRGYALWLQFEALQDAVLAFETENQRLAMERYHSARRNIVVLQYVFFLICIPTILFTVVHTLRGFRYEQQLRDQETQRAAFLKQQNEVLEERVAERTQEVQYQNRKLQQHSEEIAAQNEEITAQNEQLVLHQQQILEQNSLIAENLRTLESAQKTILCQQAVIEAKNQQLEIEVERKTKEVVLFNQQLEQFAFASAHKLRAPVARILGLSNVFKHVKGNRQEEEYVIDQITHATSELDCVIHDLTTILEVKSNVNATVTEVDFAREMQIIRSKLHSDIVQSRCVIHEDFSDAPVMHTVREYVDSILYNLVSNAIKFRSRDRSLVIRVSSYHHGDYICLQVEDNGSGFDLEKYGQDVFSLYKVFHPDIKGKGLGLHLVKMQAMALGGRAEVESLVNEGTVFRVYIRKKSEDIETTAHNQNNAHPSRH
jgi:signal transduction histidine kinase